MEKLKNININYKKKKEIKRKIVIFRNKKIK